MPGIKKKVPFKGLFPEFVDILGTPWQIDVRGFEEDPYFKKFHADGYCSNPEKLIVVCDFSTDPEKDKETSYYQVEGMKVVLRHEIVHAYLYESGLAESSNRYDGAWACHEEMVDWIAHQARKIAKTFEEAVCVRAMSPEQYTAFEQYRKEKGGGDGRR